MKSWRLCRRMEKACTERKLWSHSAGSWCEWRQWSSDWPALNSFRYTANHVKMCLIYWAALQCYRTYYCKFGVLHLKMTDNWSYWVFCIFLQNTQNSLCLKQFLDHHGLSLLWIFMVELSEAKSNSVNNIKLQLEVRVQNAHFGGN